MNLFIINLEIGDGIEIKNLIIIDSKVGENFIVGLYVYLRLKSDLGNNVKIGDFVEVKNVIIEDGLKVFYFFYIGDVYVGKNVNIGCGVVFVNYDGKNKFKLIVKDNVFIGLNFNLVVLVVVEEKGYIVIGLIIIYDVLDGVLVIVRER